MMKKLIMMALFIPLCFAGSEGGHGGDSYAKMFSSLAVQIYQELKKPVYSETLEEFKIDIEAFRETIKDTLVLSDEGDYVQLKGHQVDALNYPAQKRIIINRTRWRKTALINKLSLVFHEYLGIMRIELDHYVVTNNFHKAFEQIAQKLIVKESKIVEYFGRCVARAPLSYTGDVCDLKNESVIEAVECAKNEATTTCELEQDRECGPSQTTTQAVYSNSMLGLSYCEVHVKAN